MRTVHFLRQTWPVLRNRVLFLTPSSLCLSSLLLTLSTATNEHHLPPTWNWTPSRTASRSTTSENWISYLDLINSPDDPSLD